MLVAAALSLLAFTGPPISRRDVSVSATTFAQPISRRNFAFSAATFAGLAVAPQAAHAQRSKLIPQANKESTASFKSYQLSAPVAKPGEESAAFKQAEKLRASGGAGRSQSSTDDELARLGLKSFSAAIDQGYDECATWRGCRSRK